MTDGPRILADLRPGVRLREAATERVWTIERVVRANSYATPWVHLVGERDPSPPAGADADPRRVEGAGILLDPTAGWTYAG